MPQAPSFFLTQTHAWRLQILGKYPYLFHTAFSSLPYRPSLQYSGAAAPLLHSYETMTAGEHEALVDQILNPTAGNADSLLSGLGLASIPSRDEVHKQIEEHLLLPNSALPDHGLPTYQV